MTIKKLKEKYEDEIYERIKKEHPDFEWNSYDEGYLNAIDVNIGDAYEKGCYDVLDCIENELKEYGNYDRISIFMLKYIIKLLKEK